MRGEYEWKINWMKLYAINVYGFWMWCAAEDAGNAVEMLYFSRWTAGTFHGAPQGSRQKRSVFLSRRKRQQSTQRVRLNYDACWKPFRSLVPRIFMFLLAHNVASNLALIAVINELEGLSRGIKPSTSSAIVVASPLPQRSSQAAPSRIGNRNDPQHAAFVAQASKDALTFLNSKNPAVK